MLGERLRSDGSTSSRKRPYARSEIAKDDPVHSRRRCRAHAGAAGQRTRTVHCADWPSRTSRAHDRSARRIVAAGAVAERGRPRSAGVRSRPSTAKPWYRSRNALSVVERDEGLREWSPRLAELVGECARGQARARAGASTPCAAAALRSRDPRRGRSATGSARRRRERSASRRRPSRPRRRPAGTTSASGPSP